MLILASNSPRRRQLLALYGLAYSAMGVEIDETPAPDEHPGVYVLRLAETKARAVTARAPQDAVVVAADTTVVAVNGNENLTILGKPSNALEAEAMLRRLRGKIHQVMTALILLRKTDGLLLSDLCVTEVRMRYYSDEEVEAYIASGDPLDKAGAYAIQHPGFHPVEGLQGCYTNVVGLPLCRLVTLLERMEITPPREIPTACRLNMGNECAFSESITSSFYSDTV